jgi:hypothetical protein
MNKQLIAIIAIIGLSLTSAAATKSGDCTVITCTDKNDVAKGAVCASRTKNASGNGFTGSVQTCKSGLYCPEAKLVYVGTQNSATCVDDANYLNFFEKAIESVKDLFNREYCQKQAPGEGCSVNAHCESGVCTSKKCVGAKLDEACSAHIDCNVGLYCNASTKKCATQLVEGAACNGTDEECINTHGCSNGKCVKFYSLENGATSTNPLTCKSMYVNTSVSGTTIKSICDSQTLKSNDCTKDADQCVYEWSSDKSTASLPCQCDSTMKTNTVSCPAVKTTQNKIYTDIHTTLSWTGSCTSDYAGLDSCAAEAYIGALFTNNSTIFKVGFVLLAALMMLF